MHTIEVKMTCGCDCGSVMVRPAAAPVSPLEVVAADDIIAGWDAAVRVDTAGAVSVLPDVSGNGFNQTQAVAANQPTVGVGPNGNPSILYDGVDDYTANAALDLPAPGTTPTTFWGVLRNVATTAIENRIISTSPGALSIFNVDRPPENIVAFNGGVTSEVSAAVGTFGILDILFSNSASDYVTFAGVTDTGNILGNVDPAAGLILGTNPPLLLFANFEFCELWLFRTALTIQQRAQLRAYATNRYGAIP